MGGQILVFVEHDGKEISNITNQLVTRARQQADRLNVPLNALILGHQIQDIVQIAATMDFDSIFVATNTVFEVYNPELYTMVLANVLKDMAPGIVMFGDTYMTREIAPAIAIKLGIPFLSCCVDLELSETKIVVAQPKYGGLIYVKAELSPPPSSVLISFQSSPDLQKAECQSTPSVVPINIEVTIQDLRTSVVDIVRETPTGIDIAKADILVSGGRGLGKKDNLALLKELAQILEGTVSCSRPLTDLDWLPLSCLVGMSGKIVCPNIYLACGISGAPQHIMGMSGSRCIIAINRDVNAPIFRIAHYAVIGDVNELLPALIEQAQKAKVGNKV